MRDYYTESELYRIDRDAWMRMKGEQMKNYLEDNSDLMKVVLPIAIPVVTALVKMGRKEQRRQHEQDDRDRRFYDRSARHWWYFKRRATPREWAEIDRRHRAGESYYYIFRSMNLVD